MFDSLKITLDIGRVRNRWQFGVVALLVWAFVVVVVMYFDVDVLISLVVIISTLIVLAGALMFGAEKSTTTRSPRTNKQRQSKTNHREDDHERQLDFDLWREFLNFQDMIRKSPDVRIHLESSMGKLGDRRKGKTLRTKRISEEEPKRKNSRAPD